jgi:predicted helicase
VATFTELFGQLDPDDNIRGKQFERICKWYLEHDPFYASQLARVWLWKDWPGRWYPKKEAGIDLVAQHRDGTLWAIQAKAYDQALAGLSATLYYASQQRWYAARLISS